MPNPSGAASSSWPIAWMQWPTITPITKDTKSQIKRNVTINISSNAFKLTKLVSGTLTSLNARTGEATNVERQRSRFVNFTPFGNFPKPMSHIYLPKGIQPNWH
jgi:hypothetical protein